MQKGCSEKKRMCGRHESKADQSIKEIYSGVSRGGPVKELRENRLYFAKGVFQWSIPIIVRESMDLCSEMYEKISQRYYLVGAFKKR